MSYGGNINRGPFLDIIINWVFASVALVVVTLRLISPRALKRTSWEIDDAFVALAMVTPASSLLLAVFFLIKAYSATLDIAFAIYPSLQISKLQMPRSRKVLICVSLGLGIPAGIITIYKLTTIYTLIEAGDPTWATIPLEVWNSVESCALIFAAGIPMSTPLLQAIGDNIKVYVSRIGSSINFSTGSSRGSRLPSVLGGGSKLPSKDETSETSKTAKYTEAPVENRGSDDILLPDLRTNPWFGGAKGVWYGRCNV
ncbi:hypothetical protein EKO27_g4372 [Xylaria grammica]|uniref:Rhodopsin domain-containing protein n=1 Tax=Xylaria grammica TaxID=363999 RepID=A0A439D8K8_9PEZI|nr:hypothetical protein EKO27_g4372 [Xylaria grammica]